VILDALSSVEGPSVIYKKLAVGSANEKGKQEKTLRCFVCGAIYLQSWVGRASLCSNNYRQNIYTVIDEAVDEIIAQIHKKYKDDYLVLYSSSQIKEIPTHHFSARQLPEDPVPTKKPSGIFHHYTFFSQGIFMGLLIAVIVVPIAMMGIFWNLSVQQPQRFEKKQN
jgi:hypothetical protein